MPLFGRSEKFRCFWRILPFFLRLQRSGPRKSGKCEVRNNNKIQRNYEIKEATIFKKLIYNFISAKQLLVLPITFFFFFFLRVFNKVRLRNNNSEMVPAKSGNRKVCDGSGSWARENEILKNFMLQGSQSTGKYTTPKRSYILKSTSYLTPLAYMPSPIHAVLVTITGWPPLDDPLYGRLISSLQDFFSSPVPIPVICRASFTDPPYIEIFYYESLLSTQISY